MLAGKKTGRGSKSAAFWEERKRDNIVATEEKERKTISPSQYKSICIIAVIE